MRDGDKTDTSEFGHAVATQSASEIWERAGISTSVFVTATFASFVAENTHHPITAALVYVVGVTIIGSRHGLRWGIISAAFASFLYNFLIKAPLFAFEFKTIDDYVPLVAFNISAIISGVLAGQLKDRAGAAEQARQQLDLLLNFSGSLQKAVVLGDVATSLREFVPEGLIRSRILPELERRHGSQSDKWSAAITRCADSLLHSAAIKTRVNRLVARWVNPSISDAKLTLDNIDLSDLVDLLFMAIERCNLLDHRAEAETLKRSEGLKVAVLSSLSHDLRTPLAAIAASASGLLRFGKDLSLDVREGMLRTIIDQCNRLDRFTEKLLSIGEIQGGITEDQLEVVDTLEILGSAIASIRGLDPSREIIKEISADSAIIIANPAMLEQALLNIFENSINYSPRHGKIYVCLSIQEDHVIIRIVDFGKGLQPGDANRIFERGYRSKKSAETVSGLGLGLFIAKGFIQAFNGEISARSPHDRGSGTEIKISLPLHRELEWSTQ